MTMPDAKPDEADALDEAAAEAPIERATRRIAVQGSERTIHLDDVDDIIGIAAQMREQVAEQLTIEDLKQVASELDIEERYVEKAVEALERRRSEAEREAKLALERRTLLKKRALMAGAGVLALLVVVVLWVHSGLRGDLAEVERQRAQVKNVSERQVATETRLKDSPQGAERDAELSGAENRVRIERARYDQAAAVYNTSAGGPLGGLSTALFGLPDRVPLSNEVTSW